MSRQAVEWAAYLDLPTVRDSKGGPGGPQVPAHLLADFSEDAYRCEAIDLAYQVCSEHMQWVDSQERQEKDRQERQDALRAAKSGSPGGVGYPAAATASKAYAIGDRVEARCSNGKWYGATVREARADGSYLLDWDNKDSRERVKHSSEMRKELAVAGGGRDEVTIEFHLPTKEMTRTEAFKPWIEAFDMYGKVYEMLPNKDRAFFMTVKGPGVDGIKQLDESTWSSKLSDLGMRAGNTYTLYVKQP
jgi:hypothetical protein